MRCLSILFAVAALTGAAAPSPAIAAERLAVVGEIELPADAAAAEPSITADVNGDFLITYLEKLSDGSALRFVRLQSPADKAAHAAPVTIAQGPTLMANWANFPSLARLGNGDLVAQFPTRRGSGHAGDVQLARSTNGGASWSKPWRLNQDENDVEHGFASLLPLGGDRFAAVWLDGRATAGASPGPMTLRAARFQRRQRHDDVVVDARVCDCCQTDSAETRTGHVVVYRDRSGTEIRDVALARYQGGRYVSPVAVHADGWKMEGCPVNGPAVAARGNRVVVAWYTGADDRTRVRLAQSLDGGRTFAPPVDLDDHATGRVDVALFDDASTLVAWLAEDGGATELRAARLDQKLRVSARVPVARFEAGRSSGVPRLAVNDSTAVIVWTSSAPERTRVMASVLTAR